VDGAPYGLSYHPALLRVLASHEILHIMEHYGEVGIVVFVTVIPASLVAVVAALILRDWWMAGCFALVILIARKVFSGDGGH
jgi:hypothetical protein